MVYKKRIILILFYCSFIFSNYCLSIENKDFKSYIIKVILNQNNKISLKNIYDDKIINANISGFVDSSDRGTFLKAKIQCDILGRRYKGRVFSCGFAEVEDLKGYCQFITTNPKDSLLTYWECSTTAGSTGDPICKGKVKVIEGFGGLAGIIGFGEIEMPLIKTLANKKISYPILWNLKIKKPLNLKKPNY